MIFGIDISHYQGNFDLHRARREGYEFVIIKSTQGNYRVDPKFGRNLDQARAAGMVHAAYHYQDGNTNAAAQADHIARTVPRECPVILDVEAGGGTAALTRDLTQRLRDKGYRLPLLYLPEWYWKQIGRPSLTGLPPLWYSRYPNSRAGAASVVYDRNRGWLDGLWGGYGGLHVEVLQFSDQGHVAGHSPVDCNAYRGTRQQLEALFGGQVASAAAPPAPGGIESMGFNDGFKDWAGNDQTVLTWMNDISRKVNDLHYPAVAPGSVQSRIPGDKNVTNVFDMIKDSTSWTNQIMGRVIALQAAGAADPAAVADALRPVVAEVVGPVIQESVTAALGQDNAEQAAAIVDQISQRLGQPATEGA